MPYVLVRSLINLYEGAKIRVRVDSELFDEFEVKVRMCQGSVLSHFVSHLWLMLSLNWQEVVC